MSVVGPFWRILLHPSIYDEVGKTGTQDDTIVMDGKEYTWIGELLCKIKQGNREEKVWPFTYPELCKRVRECSDLLGVPFVPYQLRHSGASWDIARNYRTALAVQTRGGWRTTSSLVRYEKHDRMISEYEKIDETLRGWLEARHEDLREVLVHGKKVPPPPPSKQRK